MRTHLTGIVILMAGVSTLMLPWSSGAQPAPAEVTKMEIPESIRHEHHEIHLTLVEATKAPGPVGAAAKALARVLDPHFEREEEIALPPLGLVAPLSAGARVSDAVKTQALKMTDALKRELPRMLEEHKTIRAAVDGLRQAAASEKAVRYQQLADQLAHHAQTEEEVMYPTALIVGDLLRARSTAR